MSCDLELAYSPNLLPGAEAMLRVRSNQGHPQALLLRGLGSSVPIPAPPYGAHPMPLAGGGCSMRQGAQRPGDSAMVLWAAAAIAVLALRKRRRG